MQASSKQFKLQLILFAVAATPIRRAAIFIPFINMQTRFGRRQRAVSRVDGFQHRLSQNYDILPNCSHLFDYDGVPLQPTALRIFPRILRYRRNLLPLLKQSHERDPEISFAARNARMREKFNAGGRRPFVELFCECCLRESLLQAVLIIDNGRQTRQRQELR